MRTYLVAFALCGALTLVESSKCDQKIIEKIQEMWGNCIPNILETAVAYGKEVIVATTPLYYASDRKCVYSIFIKEEDQYKIVNTEVPYKGSEIRVVLPINEYEGYTNVPGRTIRRYYAFYEGGVQLVYKCTTDGEEGDAEGAVKVRASGYDEEKLTEACEIAHKLGITLSTQFDRSCIYC
ncbi:uncharacterized protein LOC124361415 [Homalodisca vitripennis]|uniref:uncharacterized protein LOC124361415 n=1 Tax=Homalodisca vitripennis TaxID=197043 RepID=UPI001EEBA9F9|nr:uncharacterized protein LOC124361415 [Homalodisca vitripennis]